MRREGKHYSDKAASIKVLGSSAKDLFDEDTNPFVRYFHFGANKQGYWSYEHLIVQLEDCVDVLKVVLDLGNYEVRFMVDHSCGHDRQREDGLSVVQMNKEYGGKQRSIHSSTMTKESLGPHSPLLKCNDNQNMVFTESSDGPFYMDPEERIILRENDLVGAKFIMKDRKKLLKEIFSSNLLPNEDTSIKIGRRNVLINRSKQQMFEPEGSQISTQLIRKFCRENDVSWRTQVHSDSEKVWKDKTRLQLLRDLEDGNHVIDKTKTKKPDLINKASQYGIPLKVCVRTGVTEKWLSKPKGKLQVARERGLLDLKSYCIEDFSDKGKTDEFGNIIVGTSLDMLLSQCSDFLKEDSLLQLNIKKLGCFCIHSPKYHCELAGEGIEYSWGNAKMKYRSFMAREKRTKAQFLEKVKYCMSREFLNIERVRKNSRRAREYMVSYFILSNNSSAYDDVHDFTRISELKPCSMSSSKIEQMKEKVRTHRAALDFDRNFCEVRIKVEKTNNVK
jgi:hypothetical protein